MKSCPAGFSPIIEIEITEACPCRCSHCFNSWANDRSHVPAKMSKEDVMRAVNMLSGHASQVVFTGGEPLLNKEALFAGAMIAASLDIPWSLNSNLLALSTHDIRMLKCLGILRVMVSVLGPDPSVHDRLCGIGGSFEKVTTSIAELRRNDIPVMAHMPVTTDNIDHIVPTGMMVTDLGASFMATAAMHSRGMPEAAKAKILDRSGFRKYVADINRFADLRGRFIVNHIDCTPSCALQRGDKLIRKPCYAGNGVGAVGPTGNVRPCPHFGDEISYGNMFRESFGDIWKRMEEWRNGSMIPEGCISCSTDRCNGGCRAEAYATTGDIRGYDPRISSNLALATT